ncbi:MAG TPA: D-cysteine desulfhydrase family protein [Acidobacteriota bacterium]|nr:D-cysteine desulfhydrase family protein [Acidobacteriota bacterium]MED5559299.1 D-cysteine desulfhydrase family protein [Acidobacteriota bacterium]HJN47449.1 D-cysteine desulfhydrase family protein [Acidobacteriota bacterium]
MRSLVEFERATLAHRPTPLEPMPNISVDLGGPDVWVKRDDCTGLGMGGNKARQLEFYFGDALARGADTVLITGAVQSNYVRATAAASAKLGMGCEIQLEERVEGMDETYRRSGNVLLNQLFGARLHSYPEGEDETGADAELDAIAERLRSQGKSPYVIYLSEGHQPLGALGYVEAAGEILEQAAVLGADFDAIVVPSGSGATQAGLLVGLRAAGSKVPVHGIAVRRDAKSQAARILRTARATGEKLHVAHVVDETDVVVHDDWLAPGYGHPSEDTLEAIRIAAQREGLLLDPVYSGKAFAGLIGLVRRGDLEPHDTILFVHTGGTPALFGYANLLGDI